MSGVQSRAIFEPSHELFREVFRTFLAKEVLPYYQQWEHDGIVDRAIWTKAGQQGFLGLGVPEEYGGPGRTITGTTRSSPSMITARMGTGAPAPFASVHHR
jgi:alkylation response protein AidB-like acyl-CoA dehydrogenase